MAYLYQSSPLFRAIVRATRNPKYLLAFVGVTTGSALLAGMGTQRITDPMMERKRHEIEHKVLNNAEMSRYASHSNNALAVLFESFGKTNQGNEKHMKYPVKLPGVMWHPGAEQREQKALQKVQVVVSEGETVVEEKSGMSK